VSVSAVLIETSRHRALVFALVTRHVASRYRGSLFGILWSILNPLFLMALYTLVFRYFMRFSSSEHYALTVLSGLLPWIWSSSALSEGTGSLVGSGHLITKSLFPAHLLPLVSVLSTLVNFVVSLPLLLMLMLVEGLPVPWTVVLLPGFVVLHFALLYGFSLALAALNVFYRDVQHLLANALSFLFFLSPIVYPTEAVPAHLRFLVVLNPFAVLTECYRDLTLRGRLPSFDYLMLCAAWAGCALIMGAAVHGRFRERFAEAL
jgi:lipopolysaccharide transport system permease protein